MKEYQISFRVNQTLYDFFNSFEGDSMSKKGRKLLKDFIKIKELSEREAFQYYKDKITQKEEEFLLKL